MGLVAASGGKNINSLIGLDPFGVFGQFIGFLGKISILLGIILVVVGLLAFFVGMGLWRGRKWARVFEIILSILWIILWAFELFKGAYLNSILIIPALIIFFYLFFSRKVRNIFR